VSYFKIVLIVFSSLVFEGLEAYAQTSTEDFLSEAPNLADDLPRKLNSVTVFGENEEIAEKTGTIILGVDILPYSHARHVNTSQEIGNQAIDTDSFLSTAAYGLSFTRVNIADDATPSLVERSAQQRYFRYSGQVKGPDHYFALNLPEGYYAISELRFNVRPSQLNVIGGDSGMAGL